MPRAVTVILPSVADTWPKVKFPAESVVVAIDEEPVCSSTCAPEIAAPVESWTAPETVLACAKTACGKMAHDITRQKMAVSRYRHTPRGAATNFVTMVGPFPKADVV